MPGIEELLMKFREIENDLNDGGSVDVETVENLTAPVLVRLHRERKHLTDRRCRQHRPCRSFRPGLTALPEPSLSPSGTF